MTSRQKRQVALDIGRCSDGRPCGEVHEFCQDAYCPECPNNPMPVTTKQPYYQDTQGGDWIDECALTFTTEEFRGAMRFNIGKYNRRAGKKDDLLKEINKIKDYASRWLAYENHLIDNEIGEL